MDKNAPAKGDKAINRNIVLCSEEELERCALVYEEVIGSDPIRVTVRPGKLSGFVMPKDRPKP